MAKLPSIFSDFEMSNQLFCATLKEFCQVIMKKLYHFIVVTVAVVLSYYDDLVVKYKIKPP